MKCGKISRKIRKSENFSTNMPKICKKIYKQIFFRALETEMEISIVRNTQLGNLYNLKNKCNAFWEFYRKTENFNRNYIIVYAY